MGHFHFDPCQFLAMKFKRLLKLSRCQWAAQEKSQWDKDDFIRKSQGDAEFSSLKPTALKPTVGPVPDFRPRLREPQGPSDHSSRVGFHPGQDKTLLTICEAPAVSYGS